jgi:hypothetical protein
MPLARQGIKRAAVSSTSVPISPYYSGVVYTGREEIQLLKSTALKIMD